MPDSRDERAHPPGSEPAWTEVWEFAFRDQEAGSGGASVALVPHQRIARYEAGLSRPGARQLIVTDAEGPLPGPGRLELRSSGLWADHHCEEPFVHWTIGLEAFALEVDDPDDERGDPVALGFDLEWEATAEAVPVEAPSPSVDGYSQECEVHGEVLVADHRIEVAGTGWRRHVWGAGARPLGWALRTA